MEHIVVAIRPGQGPEVVAWALQRARRHGGALEIIASGLEWPDPHSALLGVGLQLIAAGSDVPFSMRTVAAGMPAALTVSTRGMDEIVLGSRRGGPNREEAAFFVSLASACSVVIVPAGWRVDSDPTSPLATEAVAPSELTDDLLTRLCTATTPIRIVPLSFAERATSGP